MPRISFTSRLVVGADWNLPARTMDSITGNDAMPINQLFEHQERIASSRPNLVASNCQPHYRLNPNTCHDNRSVSANGLTSISI